MTADHRPGASANATVLCVFAPLLVLAGVGGWVIPPELSLTSGATPYNVFHVAFGFIGLAAVRSGREGAIRAFNGGFGAIDLYQALASWLGLFPAAWFAYRPADDLLHVVIGAGLVGVALLAVRRPPAHGGP